MTTTEIQEWLQEADENARHDQRVRDIIRRYLTIEEAQVQEDDDA